MGGGLFVSYRLGTGGVTVGGGVWRLNGAVGGCGSTYGGGWRLETRFRGGLAAL